MVGYALSEKMEIKMDYYKVLGINEKADAEQIKQVYRRLAKKYHPDLNPDNSEAEAKFKDIVEAYETLGDAQKRHEYDLNFGNFTKDMEKYFGFSFTEKSSGNVKSGGREKKNPLDVTEMFEAFMKMK